MTSKWRRYWAVLDVFYIVFGALSRIVGHNFDNSVIDVQLKIKVKLR